MDVYPILKPHDWSAKRFAVQQPFMGIDREPMPVISYGYSLEGHYQFVTQDPGGPTLETIHQQAIANLEAAPGQWERITDTMLTGSGEDFSAEKILSPTFINQAQQILGTSPITVASPRRRVIYATSAPEGSREFEEFSTLVWRTWLDDSYGNAPICSMLFTFEGFTIVRASVLDPIP